MSASTKLSSSVKALCFLAEAYPDPKSSKEIAEHTGINASKLRQLLSMLAKAEIVKSEQGTKGGFSLCKDPLKIDLQEIYCSIEDRKAFHLDVVDYNSNGKKAPNYTDYFLDLFAEVQVDIENKMKDISLLSVMQSLNIKSNFRH